MIEQKYKCRICKKMDNRYHFIRFHNPMNSLKSRLKIGLANKGKTHKVSEEAKRKIGLANTGLNNKKWQINPTYSVIHDWVKYHLGKPGKCKNCKKDNLKGIWIHWANKSGEYKRDLTDWIRLCAQCHKDYDKIHPQKKYTPFEMIPGKNKVIKSTL